MWTWPFPDLSNQPLAPDPSSGAGGAAAASNPLGAIAAPVAQSAGQPMQLPGAALSATGPEQPQNDYAAQDSRNASFGAMGQIGALLMAAGQRMTPQQRATLIAGIAPVLGNMPREAQYSAQTRLIQQKTQEAQGASQRRSEAIASALNDPGIPQEVKMLLKADPDKGFEYLAKLMTPIQKQDNWQMHSNPATGETYMFNAATGEVRPTAGLGGSLPGGGDPSGNSVSAGPANGIMRPDGLNPVQTKAYDTEMGKTTAERQAEIVREGELAQRLLPGLNEAQGLWGEMEKAGALGPWVGNPVVRQGEKMLSPLVPSVRRGETLREKFDEIQKNMQTWKAQENKGQGPVSDFERKLYDAATGGRMDAVDPSVGRASLARALALAQQKVREAQDARLGKFPDLNPGQRAQPRLPGGARPVAINPKTGEKLQLSEDGTRWEPL